MLDAQAGDTPVILHCFSAPWRAADAAERGWYCSFAGHTTYPASDELREAAAQLPAELILVETDAPYLAPQTVRGKPNEPAYVVDTARVVAAARGRLLRGAGADRRGERPHPLRLVGEPAVVRLGQNFLADPNLLDAIVRDAELEPADVVLEVGAGEGVLTERLAAAAAHVHTVEIDRSLEPALAPLAAHPEVELHWGDAMKLDLAGFDPAPSAVVANLPYSIATPLILRTIEQLPSVQRWTVMVQREIADRLRAAPGSRDLRLAERAGAARLRGEAAAHRRPGRLPAAAAGRVGDHGPAPHRARRRRGHPRARPRRLRPPPQVAGPLAGARPPRLAGRHPRRPARAGDCRGCTCRGALPGGFRRPGGETGRQRVTPAPMRIHAPAKLNLCLFLGPRRDDGLHELCSLFEPLALADAIEVSEADRDEVVCPGVEGENLAARALAALRERGWDGPPLRIEIEKRIPVAAGLGGGSADAAAVLRLARGRD